MQSVLQSQKDIELKAFFTNSIDLFPDPGCYTIAYFAGPVDITNVMGL